MSYYFSQGYTLLSKALAKQEHRERSNCLCINQMLFSLPNQWCQTLKEIKEKESYEEKKTRNYKPLKVMTSPVCDLGSPL